MNLFILVKRSPIFVGMLLYFAFGPGASTFGETTDLDEVARRLSVVLQKAQVQTVVVGDFAGIQELANLQGVLLADRVWFALLQEEKGFKTLNRGALHKELYGQRFSNGSFAQAQLDAAHAAGAEVLITGKVERRTNNLSITIAALNISAAKEIAQWNWVVPRSASLDHLAVQPIQSTGPVYVLEQDGVSTPSCLYCPYPEYVEAAKKEKIEGTVVVEAMIDGSGRTTNVWEVRGLPDGLTEQAMKVVRQWKFKSAQNADGRAVPVMVPVDVTFRLM